MARSRKLVRVAGVAAAILVVAGALVPSVLSDFSLQLTALFLPFTILALSVDLLWGENKLITFGQGAFFAVGGYVGGLVLLGHTSSVSSGGASLLDDTATTSGFDAFLESASGVHVGGLPILGLLLPVLLAGIVGLLIGLVVFRAATPEVYLPLMTLGIGVVAGIWFNGSAALGGSNGLSGIPSFVDEFADSGNSTTIYRFNLVFVVLAYGGYWAFRKSQRGRTWRALGDDPVRLEALGYPVKRLRAYGFGASTALAGLAGALYAGTSGFMGPSVAGVTLSAQALIWVAVGGVGTVLGPLVGTLIVKWAEQKLSSDLGLDDSWQLLLGLVLIVVVIAAPRGLMGLRGTGRGLHERLPAFGDHGNDPSNPSSGARALSITPTTKEPS